MVKLTNYLIDMIATISMNAFIFVSVREPNPLTFSTIIHLFDSTSYVLRQSKRLIRALMRNSSGIQIFCLIYINISDTRPLSPFALKQGNFLFIGIELVSL